MNLQEYTNTVIETDLLVVGGGTGGAPLAAKAAEAGLDVTILEKSDVRRSGNIAHGVDSYGIFPHEISIEDLIPLYYERMTGRNQGTGRNANINVDYRCFKEAWWGVTELERFGINMKWDDGEYYWVPHMIHGKGGLRLGLRVHWHDVKPKMDKMCRDRGVHILNRVMLCDLLTHDGRVIGATALNTRTGEFMVFKAKAVAICTGMFCRMYQPETPLVYKYQMRYHYNPASCSGDGWAAAYRAGAGLVYMDDASWALRIRDDITCSYGNFVNNDGYMAHQYYWNGEPASPYHCNTYLGNREAESMALTPIYQSLENMPDAYQDMLEMNFLDERMVSLKIAEERGFNPRNHRYEMMNYKPLQQMMVHGLLVDENFTNPYLKGLFAVGDAAAGVGGAYGAVTSGLLVGRDVSGYISGVEDAEPDEGQIAESYHRVMDPASVKDGTLPMEMECTLRYLMERYCGALKSEGKLTEGIRRMSTLKNEFLPNMMAPNPHYMMRALEFKNILQLAEMHLYGSYNRKETRGQFVRLDYPEIDHSRDDNYTVNRIVDGEDIVEMVPIPGPSEELMKAAKQL